MSDVSYPVIIWLMGWIKVGSLSHHNEQVQNWFRNRQRQLPANVSVRLV